MRVPILWLFLYYILIVLSSYICFSLLPMAKVSAEGLHEFRLRTRSSLSCWENWCRQSAPTCLSSLSKILEESSSLSSGTSIANGYWVFITMCWYNHNRTACRFNIQLLQDFLVLSIGFNHIYNTEATVSDKPYILIDV